MSLNDETRGLAELDVPRAHPVDALAEDRPCESIQQPNAMLARRLIFCAASPPLTSRVGSASAKPFSCAWRRASS